MNLLDAVIEGDLDEVKELVEQGADIHARNDDALRCASENGHLDVVKFLKRVIKLRNISVKIA
jgi:ankyrin repeat protein